MKSVKDQLYRPQHSPHLPSVDSDAVRLEVNENVREKVADGALRRRPPSNRNIQDEVKAEVQESARPVETPVESDNK